MSQAAPPAQTTTLTIDTNTVRVPNVCVQVTMANGHVATVPLTLEAITLGSDANECDICIVDPGVSRKHCEVTQEEGRGVVLRDLNSKNGTYIGAIRVSEVVLPLETIVTVGRSSFAVRVVGAPIQVELHPRDYFGSAVGRCVRMRSVFAQLQAAADSIGPLMILGERGTGKSMLATIVHNEGLRKDGPLEVLSCAVLSGTELDVEIFGSDSQQFPGALKRAHGGTLIIEDIDEMPWELQVKLLRAVQPRSYARLISTSRQRVGSLARAGAFDLTAYLHLAKSEVHLPPLRHRREDIPLLLMHFLGEERSISDLPHGTLELLLSHNFPGNVLELSTIAERLCVGTRLDAFLAHSAGIPSAELQPWDFREYAGLSLRVATDRVVCAFQRYIIVDALRKNGNNITYAAKALDMPRPSLHRLLQELNIEVERPAKD